MNTTEISSGLNWTSIFKAFHRTQMRLRRDRLRIILRPCAICHKFRLFTGFAAAFLARQVPTSGRRKTVAKTDSRGWAVCCDISPPPILAYCRLLQAIVVHDSGTC